jgi:flavin-binding protein dodecin
MALSPPTQRPQNARNPTEERLKNTTATPVGKVIELVGSSSESFEDAIRAAVRVASASVRNITGVEVKNMTCAIRENEIREFRVDIKLAFGVESEHPPEDGGGV